MAGLYDFDELIAAVDELTVTVAELVKVIDKMGKSKGETHTHIHYPPATPMAAPYNPYTTPDVRYNGPPIVPIVRTDKPIIGGFWRATEDGALEKNPDAADSG